MAALRFCSLVNFGSESNNRTGSLVGVSAVGGSGSGGTGLG